MAALQREQVAHGAAQSKNCSDEVFRETVHKHVWKHVKFPNGEKELEAKGPLCNLTMEGCNTDNMEEEQMLATWRESRGAIKKMPASKRNNITNELRKEIRGKQGACCTFSGMHADKESH